MVGSSHILRVRFLPESPNLDYVALGAEYNCRGRYDNRESEIELDTSIQSHSVSERNPDSPQTQHTEYCHTNSHGLGRAQPSENASISV